MRHGILKTMAKNAKSKATNSATCAVYQALWNEAPPKGKRKTGGKKKG